MVVFEQCPNRSIVEQLVKMRKHLYDFPQRNLVPLLKWKKIFWQERLRQVEILKNGTPSELGSYTRDVHWRVQGREEYRETLFAVKPGTAEQYFAQRLLRAGARSEEREEAPPIAEYTAFARVFRWRHIENSA